MKTDRLLGTVIYLLNNGRTSAQRLAEEFEVSPRTIMRDMDAIAAAGIPVRPVSGTGGGYEIMDDFLLDRQITTAQDYAWIVEALKGMAGAYAGSGPERALDNLMRLRGADEAPVSVDISAAREDAQVNDMLVRIEKAVRLKRAVSFTYTDSRGETKRISAEPVSLEYKWYNWYMRAYYEKYNDVCMFKLLRMEELRTTDASTAHAVAASDGHGAGARQDIVHVKLRCKRAVRSKCREYLHGQVTREYDNGDFEYEFAVPEHETFWFGAVMAMGGNVHVTSPAHIRERILRTCREIQAEYGKEIGHGGDNEIRSE